jgi:1-phosphofructokinase family hexose kinase
MVARALAQEVSWVGFLGGAAGEECENGLSALGIPVTVVRTRADTRANLEIIARDGTVTEILEPGGAVTDGEVERLLSACRDIFAECGEGSQVALSGSLPPGAPADFYADLIRLAHVYGCRVLLDTSGEALRQALAARPDLVKPNRAEATAFAGRTVVSTEVAAEVAREMIHAGAHGVAVSLGVDGIIWVSAENNATLISQPPPVMVRSTVGCGDAALAGFAVAYARGLGDEDALCLAVACGTANCLADSPGLVDPLEVERIRQQLSVQALQADSREVKTRGEAR